MKVYATYTNEDLGLEASIIDREGKHAVVFRDTDAEQVISVKTFPIGKEREANNYAQQLVA